MDVPASGETKPTDQALGEALGRMDDPSVQSIWDATKELTHLRSPDDKEPRPIEWVAEIVAFRFSARRDRADAQELHFGPLSTWVGKDGATYSDPDVRQVTAAMVSHWEHRAGEAVNPMLVARYADLVWTLKQAATGERANPDFARQAASAYMRVVEMAWFDHPLYAIDGIRRALEIALQLNDTALAVDAGNALWRAETEHASDDKPGLWGHSFRCLVLEKSPMPADAKAAIVAEMEARFDRLRDGDPWARESAAKMLSEFYQKSSRPADAKAVWRSVGETFENAINEDEALQASSWLQHVAALYQQHGLKDEHDQVVRKIAVIGRKARSQMQVVSQEISIPAAEMEKAIAAHFDESVQQTVLTIALSHTPDRERLALQLRTT